MPISGGLSGIWDYAKGMFGNEPQQVPNQPGTDQIPQDTQSIEALFGGNPNAANKQAASPVGMAKEDLEKQGMVANKDGNFYPSGSSSSSEMMYKLDPESGQYVLAPNYKSSGGLMDFTPMPGAGAQFAGQIGRTAATVGMALRPDNPLNAILNARLTIFSLFFEVSLGISTLLTLNMLLSDKTFPVLNKIITIYIIKIKFFIFS